MGMMELVEATFGEYKYIGFVSWVEGIVEKYNIMGKKVIEITMDETIPNELLGIPKHVTNMNAFNLNGIHIKRVRLILNAVTDVRVCVVRVTDGNKLRDEIVREKMEFKELDLWILGGIKSGEH